MSLGRDSAGRMQPQVAAARQDRGNLMLEQFQTTFLTEQQLSELIATQHPIPATDGCPPKTAEPSRAMPCRSTHWTKRLRDPLGDALVRIKLTNHGAQAIEQPVIENSIFAEAAQSLESETPLRSETSIHLAERETLPMFDTEPAPSVQGASSSSGEERRKFARRNSECHVSVVSRADTVDLTPREIDWLLKSGHSVGRMQNLGQLGICLLLKKDIPVGTELVLRITNELIQRNVDMSARVLRSQPNRPGFFSIHCQTLRDFTLDELQDLGQQPNAS